MGTIDFTTVLALDEKHLGELRHTWPTWARNRPEILHAPLLIFCDVEDHARHSINWWRNELAFALRDHKHEDLRLIPWPMSPDQWGFEYEPGNQREKMLGAFIAAPRFVRTKWFLKLDTDVVAMQPGTICDPSWFDGDPAFVSSPWSYTKPANAIDRLDEWAAKVPELARHAPLELHPEPGWSRVMHRRIISYVYFGLTDWHVGLAGMVDRHGPRLPVPSQDTLAWYVAKRTGRDYRTVKFGAEGWAHVRPRRLEDACEEALASRVD